MTKYEVRVTQTHVDYYRIDAKDQDQAKALIRQHINEGDTFIEAEKVDTILRPSEIDYAVKVDNKGEVTYQWGNIQLLSTPMTSVLFTKS